MAVELTTGRAMESQHWYDKTGAPVFELRGSNGAMRPATLRDARRLGLVPGFSTIAQQEHKPQLVRWQIDQAYLAALTLPCIDGETLEQFKARAYQDAQAQSTKARDRGTYLHAALQGYYEDYPVSTDDKPFVVPVAQWLIKRFPDTVWDSEQSFAHPAGYGGKCDLRSAKTCPHAVIDFKFKDFTQGTIDKVRGYDEHEMQLHAYECGFGMVNAVKLNLFISSTVPGLIVPVEWPTNPASLEAFLCLLRLYQLRKKYDSSFVREIAA